MLADEHPQMEAKSAKTLGGSPMSLMLYVDNVDALAAQAVAAGAKVIRPIQNQFYGDRSGTFEDPFGFKWTISTHVEDVPPEEMKRRMDEAMKQKSS
jgi:PhnB protein